MKLKMKKNIDQKGKTIDVKNTLFKWIVLCEEEYSETLSSFSFILVGWPALPCKPS